MVTLTVAGTAQHFHPAERGTVRLEIRRESRSRSAVLAEVSSLHATVRDQARAEQQSGAATWWSADQVSVSTVRRFLKDSDVAEVFHVAAASVRVKYRDFDALGRWVSTVSGLPGVVVAGVEWDLTAARRASVERDVRVAASATRRSGPPRTPPPWDSASPACSPCSSRACARTPRARAAATER
ncbi:hypothetical protein B0T42_08695 [Rathayibacter sp. VKM Ac-2630]|nr:hypothetical protein B0T42_08695 [Rathayibacter sp. VKM Ac-2630]